MRPGQHGGNIYKKAGELGISQDEIFDFSANINPLGLPQRIKDAIMDSIGDMINYPDPDSTELTRAISACDQIPEDYIVCGNGGADLLYRIAFGLKPGKVLLPVPSFSEYEEALRAAGADMVYYRMGQDLQIHRDFLEEIKPGIDMVVVCNPNNPTGILTEKDFLTEMIEKAGQAGAKVLLDECFLEICQEADRYSLIPETGIYPHLIILKSFTKLYAMPGLRLGYTICGDPEVNSGIVQAGQAWPVSGIAQKAGLAALSDPDYRDQVVEIVSEERAFMKKELSRLPIRLYDGRANYLFFQAPGIDDLDRRLEKYRILIRNCSNYVNLGPDYWRIAVKNHEENVYLLKALEEVLNQGR